MSIILPGATIGILGGGQLGRMTAMAARSLGYHLAALDPDPSCAARFLVETCVTAGFDDVQAARELAARCNVVTVEIEKVSASRSRRGSSRRTVRPTGSSNMGRRPRAGASRSSSPEPAARPTCRGCSRP